MAEEHSQTPRGRQPISRHPLFPWIAALWGGALLGLGSLAIDAGVLESLVLALRMDSVVPAAAPPLGLTARMLAAMIAGGLGGALGWLLATRVGMARPRTAAGSAETSNEACHRPAKPTGKGRLLGDFGRSRREAPQIFDVNEAALDSPFERSRPDAMQGTRYEAAASRPAAPHSPAFLHGASTPQGETAADRIATAELDSLSPVELVERLAMAMDRRRMRAGVQAPESAAPPSGASEPVARSPDQTDRHVARLPLRPPSSRPAPEETEKALRDALAALQRMSGSR